MAPRRRPDYGHAWRQITERLRRERDFCEMPVCLSPAGRRIDKPLRYPDPWSFTVDHIEDVKVRPDLALEYRNTRPAHNRCNRMKRVRDVGPPSRQW